MRSRKIRVGMMRRPDMNVIFAEDAFQQGLFHFKWEIPGDEVDEPERLTPRGKVVKFHRATRFEHSMKFVNALAAKEWAALKQRQLKQQYA